MAGMTLSTPGIDQGQIVERSYGWYEGEYYRRIIDRSDGETTWYVATDAASDRVERASYCEGNSDRPPVEEDEWLPCADPCPNGAQ